MSTLLLTGSASEALGMVVGSRAHLEEDAIAKRHWFRNFLMRGFHLLVLMVAGGAIKDTQCGFKVPCFIKLNLLLVKKNLPRRRVIASRWSCRISYLMPAFHEF